MHFCQEPQPRYAKTGVIISYMQMKDVAQWANTTVGHRGADYEAFKRQKAEQLIKSVGLQFPHLRDNIKHYYTSTPLTYRDYTGTEGGGIYGIARDIHLGAACRVPHRTKIPNVWQTGQNINSHGILGVIVGTIVTCSELLTAERIYQQCNATLCTFRSEKSSRLTTLET
jgi:all-trans-retinol 13,14-reductase